MSNESGRLPDFPGTSLDGETFVTADFLAERWGQDRESIYRLSSTALPKYQFGTRTVRYRWTDVLRYERECRVGPST